jgi:hypothetical protein
MSYFGIDPGSPQVWFRQIFLTISDIWLNICEKSCLKSVTIRVTSLCWLLQISVLKKRGKSFMENLVRYADKEEKICGGLSEEHIYWNGKPK